MKGVWGYYNGECMKQINKQNPILKARVHKLKSGGGGAWRNNLNMLTLIKKEVVREWIIVVHEVKT